MEEGSFVYTVFICVINSFSSYTAIMLNCLTIHAIRRTPSLPQTLKTLLLSLAVSDLGVGLVVQPCSVADRVMTMLEYTENDLVYATTKQVHIFSLTIFSTASFLGVVTLSLDRFLAINYCLRLQTTNHSQARCRHCRRNLALQRHFFANIFIYSVVYRRLDNCHN